MKIYIIFFAWTLLVTSLTTVNGQNVSESNPVKVYVGPFITEFKWNTSNPGIDILNPQKMKDFNNYEFWINTGQYFDSPLPIERHIVTDIDDHGVATDVSDEKLKSILLKKFVPNGENKTVAWDTINISGLPGVEGIVNITDYSNEYYIAAFSPDAGNQGSLIVSIMSFASKDLTDMFLRSLKITRA